MDRLTTLREWAAKYKYVIAVVLLGVLLMLLPSGSRREARNAAPAEAESRSTVQGEMEATLAAFDGAGRLRLMLTADPVTERWAGAVVVCEGGGSAAVRLQLTQAIGALTGLPSDKIAVVKGTPK
ncbi:MAG: hypothetical protein IJV43_04355 [Oscillospiraceae bacterium]|nr:hypothetical protein [Oscillospiraceae bacterium]